MESLVVAAVARDEDNRLRMWSPVRTGRSVWFRWGSYQQGGRRWRQQWSRPERNKHWICCRIRPAGHHIPEQPCRITSQNSSPRCRWICTAFTPPEEELGPSGMTAEHLKPMLETEVDSRYLYEVAVGFARGEAPQEVVNALMGRMTALQKDDGGVRGIVVGDVFRRLVARVQQSWGECHSPFQFALSTRAGCESVTHVIRAATDINDRTTIVSVDGIGAYDSISRNSMLEASTEWLTETR